MNRDIGSDNPATRPEEDAFNRWPFSRRLAETICQLDTEQGAPVLGLFGKWGDGKSSVLNFVRYALETDHADAVTVCTFNPWLFQDQSSLVQEFFTTLARSIETAIDKPEKAVGDLLSRYSGALGAIPLVGTALKDVAKGAGDAMTADSIAARRDRLVAAMRGAPKRVVVLVDDLDRLDRDEVMTMMKLVRLSANFPNVVYLLAFDEERVARLAGRAYGGRSDGRQFLEKIIQFPFSLPAVGRARLAAYVIAHARTAAETADLRFSDSDWAHVRKQFEEVVLSRLTTPRQAIRYANALRFAMPLLKGEVGPYNQMLVEAARVLFPELYTVLKNHPDPGAMTIDDIMARGGLGPEDRALAEVLLRGEDGAPKPITDPRYHSRYFSYAVASDDISDAELALVLAAANDGDQNRLDDAIRCLARDRFDGLVDRLLAKDVVMQRAAASHLALALTTISDFASPIVSDDARLGKIEKFTFRLAQAVVHFADQPSGGRQTAGTDTFQELVAIASPLSFALEIYEVLLEADKTRAHDEEPQPDRASLRQLLVSRVITDLEQRPLGDVGKPWTFFRLMHFWKTADRDGQRRWLAARLTARPEEAIALIPLDIDGHEHRFARVSLMCDPEPIAAALRAHFGPALDNSDRNSAELKMARGFLAAHAAAV